MTTYSKNNPKTIQSMFNSIAKDYDKANTILSFGLHKKWNHALVKALTPAPQDLLLDLCAGTGAIAFTFLQKHPKARAILLDFSSKMLERAQKNGGKFQNRSLFLQADAQKIPLQKESVDLVCIAYGIRNLSNLEKSFQEVYKVLRPGGKFAILELTRPPSSFLHFAHTLYLKTCLPLIGKVVAKNHAAYAYLAKSISTFSSPQKITSLLQQCGFAQQKETPLARGIATIITTKKPYL